MNPAIEKIRALRELAAGTTNEHEARAAARQAARIAEKHRIAEAEIEAAASAGAPPAAVVDGAPVYRGGAIPGWKGLLINVIAKHFGCALMRERVRSALRPSEQRLVLVGTPGDIELAREAIGWLMLQVAVLCQAVGAGRGKAWRSSWSVGCVAGIRDQLDAGKREARAEGATSTALVRLDARVAEAKLALEAAGVTKRAAKRTVEVSTIGAYASGFAEGRRMPIQAATAARRAVRALEGAP